MKRHFFYILTITLFSQFGYTQTTIERSIQWQTRAYHSDTVKSYLWFENAIYSSIDNKIPRYFELISLDSFDSATDSLQVNTFDEKWEELKEIEQPCVPEKNFNNQETISISQFQISSKPYLQLTIPVIKTSLSVKTEKLISFKLSITKSKKKVLPYRDKLNSIVKNESVLSTGKWIKFNVDKSGIHKITYAELQSLGLSNLENVSVWGNGGKALPYLNNQTSPDDLTPIPIYIERGADGIFNSGDYILFYTEGPKVINYSTTQLMWQIEQHPYTKQAHYFLTSSHTQNIISESESAIEDENFYTNAYDAIVTFEKNDTNLVKSGREWFGDFYDVNTTQTYSSNLSAIQPGSEFKVWIRAAARSTASSNFSLKANSSLLGNIYLNGVTIGDELADVASVKSEVFTSTASSNTLSLELTYNKPNSASVGWLDFITINARHELKYSNTQLIFFDHLNVGTGNVTKFDILNTNQDTRIWDISNINSPFQIKSQLNGTSLTFKQNTDTLRKFIAFEPSNAYAVNFVGEVPNQNIHGLSQPDMVIVTHENFIEQAEELANIHEENDGLNVAVVTNEQVYNEFSSGNPDVSAIRNLMRMLYKRASNEDELPKYLLLFGDGSFDNLTSTVNNTNFILTYQSDRSINKTNSFVTDDYFGLLDDNEGNADGLLDIGIGRIPVKTTDEANVVIAKIKQYISNDNIGDWQNKLCFIGDDEDGNTHMQDANSLADYVKQNHKEYNIQKIFFDAYKQEISSTGATYPDVTKSINNTVNNGALLVNYTGHGNERWLAHEKVLMLDDVLSWNNFKSLSLFITATCEFSRFDDYNLTSTGEMILLSPNGGAIALLSTSRLVYSSPNFVLNYNFIKTLFTKAESTNNYYTLGDLVKITKNISGTGYNKRNFSLLGDPALRLRNPNYKMEVTEINNKPITEPIDTLKALDNIKLTGHIVDANGNTVNNFDGTATLTVFDKAKNITTISNDGGLPYSFTSYENTLYKGTSQVENGLFEINFVVPKDINYQFGPGRISLFAMNSEQTALGANDTIIIGGVSNNPAKDSIGPEIEIYLNDEKFISGGISDQNPKLLVKLFDESGINTTGIGIGHDLTATLMDETNVSQKYILNNYYQSEIGSYQKGSVDFQLSNLTFGNKALKIKAWDIYNNSSEATINFRVTDGTELTIKNFHSYPNPFTDKTSMYFEHNQPDANLSVEIDIYNFSGMLVRKISHTEQSSNYRVGPIEWDGLSHTGSRLGRGVYICRLVVKSSTGENAQLQQKLIIMR